MNEKVTRANKRTLNLSQVWIVIPAYNEEESIGIVLDQFIDKDYSILVIDDCSKDKTSEVTLKYPVTLLKHMINLGQGAALQTGFDYIVQHTNAKYVVTFDSDGQHDVEDIPKILAPLTSGQYDAALGSRFLKPGNVDGIPWIKLFTLKAGVLFTRISTGLKVTDTHNGFRAFTIETLRKIHINQNRMAHASEILTQIAQNKLGYCEVPVIIRYTEYSKKKGQSIFNSLNILWDLLFGRD
ncbi:MAG: glycosyltransferase family 2 protein [Anaerolinea sp.]|nr:glycosyltransferase family 2 protein [Anaerolinea sp.]